MRNLIDKTEATRLIEEGLSASEIAERLSVTRQAVHQFASAEGISLRVRPQGGRPKTTSGRSVCLKLQVPLAVKRWAAEHGEEAVALLTRCAQGGQGA